MQNLGSTNIWVQFNIPNWQNLLPVANWQMIEHALFSTTFSFTHSYQTVLCSG